jgi:hypothetical protein
MWAISSAGRLRNAAAVGVGGERKAIGRRSLCGCGFGVVVGVVGVKDGWFGGVEALKKR